MPPAKGLSEGPIMVACQWNMSSPTGPGNVNEQMYAQISSYIYMSSVNWKWTYSEN